MLESRLRSFKLQAFYVYNKQNVVPCSIHLAPYMLVCCLSLMPQYSSTTLPGFLTSHSPIAFFWLAVTTSLGSSAPKLSRYSTQGSRVWLNTTSAQVPRTFTNLGTMTVQLPTLVAAPSNSKPESSVALKTLKKSSE